MKFLNEDEVRGMLQRTSAVITGSHIVYTSGKHGSAYVNKDAVYPHTHITSQLCQAIGDRFSDEPIDYVIAPAVGGVILSQWTAHHLKTSLQHDVKGVYADKDGDRFVVKRGYDALIRGKRGLIVEDILNTGGSVAKVVSAVRACESEVIGVGALVNRGGVTAEQLDVPVLHALLNVQMEAWDEADCPLCRDGVPINTSVGKGREYLARKNAAVAPTA